MGSLLGKITQFARSPQGKSLLQKAEKAAQDPKTQKTVEDAAAKVEKRL
jgi:hypothetical protein